MNTEMKNAKVGDRAEMVEYVNFRQRLIGHWSKLKIAERSLNCDELKRDVSNLIEEYMLAISGRRIFCIRDDACVDDLIRMMWKLTPPYFEVASMTSDGRPKWTVRMSSKVTAADLNKISTFTDPPID